MVNSICHEFGWVCGNDEWNSQRRDVMHSETRRRGVIGAVLALSAIFGSDAVAAPAGSTPQQLDTVVVTGSHIPTAAGDLSVMTTIIDREAIEIDQPGDMVELLRLVPGVHVDHGGGPGGVGSVYLRGADPNFTTVLVDGVKVNDPMNSRGGSFDFSTFGIADVDRVEIYRGALSSVHGSDAMAGTVNIVTRKGGGRPRVDLEGVIGENGARRGAAGFSGALGDAGTLAIGFQHSDSGAQVPGSSFEGSALRGNIEYTPAGRVSLEAGVRIAESERTAFPDDSGGPEFALFREVDTRIVREMSARSALDFEPSTRWRLGLNATWYARDEDLRSPGVAPGLRNIFGVPRATSRDDFERVFVRGNVLFEQSNYATLTAGADFQVEHGRSASNVSSAVPGLGGSSVFEFDRDTFGLFAEMELRFGSRLITQLGIRRDAANGFSRELSPRAGFVYRFPWSGGTLRGNWGQGFKLPSFFALGNAIVGNPELFSEKSESTDFSVEQIFCGSRCEAGLALYYSKFENLVDFDEAAFRLVNRSLVRSRGFEAWLAVEPFDGFQVDGHFTYTATGIDGSREELRNRPRWRGGLTLRWRPGSVLQLGLRLLHVGETHDSSVPTGARRLPAYQRLDGSGSWEVDEHLRIAVAVDNVLDGRNAELVGFPAPGRRVSISARLQF